MYKNNYIIIRILILVVILMYTHKYLSNYTVIEIS